MPGRVDDFLFVGGISGPNAANTPVGKIFKFNETTQYQTIVYDRYKTSIYALSAINIDQDEHVTSWVINKALDKLLFNHRIFSDNVHSKYVGKYNTAGRIEYNGVNYITDSDIDSRNYVSTLDNYIGINEPVLAETINRPLNEIYKLQLKMLSMCKEKYSNKYPPADRVVEVT
jgi:hypothetical protein